MLILFRFVFYRYGGKIRAKSALIKQMREDKQKQDRRRKRHEEKMERRAEAEIAAGPGMETGAAVVEQIDIEKDLEKGALEKTSES